MLLIVVMHRWGNYARILNRLVASAGSAPTLDSMANAIKASGSGTPSDSGMSSPPPDDQEPDDTKGITPGARRLRRRQPKDGEDKAKEEKKIKHARTDGSGVLRIYIVGRVQRRRLSHDGRLLKANGADQKSDDGDDKKDGGGGGGGGGGGDTGKIGEMTKLAKASIGRYVYHQWYEPRLHPTSPASPTARGLYGGCTIRSWGMDIGRRRHHRAHVPGRQGHRRGWRAASTPPARSGEGDLIVRRWYSGGGRQNTAARR